MSLSKRLKDAFVRRWSGTGLMFAAGLIAAAGQAPLHAAPLTVLALAFAMWASRRFQTWGQAAWRGWALGLGYFCGTLFWIVEPFLVDVATHGWLAPFGLFGLAGGMALYWAGAFALGHLVASGRDRVLALVVLLTVAEFFRSTWFTGFPWALIGHVWIGWPQMQLAAFGGPHMLTLLTLAAAAMLVVVPREFWVRVLYAVALLLSPTPYQYYRMNLDPEPRNAEVIVRVIQPNAPQHLKWEPEMIPVFFRRSLDQTSAEGDPDLIIWPETSVPVMLNDSEQVRGYISEAAGDTPVIFGVQRWDDDGFPRNSLAVIDGSGDLTHTYDKAHLVPWGEYMPYRGFFERLGITGLAALDVGGYASGPGIVPLDLGGDLGVVMPLICYEMIFPNDLRAAEGVRADWIVHITNDAWFGQIAGPHQHLAQARLRAVEQGLPVLRSANTGISGVIDPWGRVLGSLPLGAAGYLDAALPPPLALPPYQRYGEIPVGVALLMISALGLLRIRRKRLDPARASE